MQMVAKMMCMRNARKVVVFTYRYLFIEGIDTIY
jgi:hypothetical protein